MGMLFLEDMPKSGSSDILEIPISAAIVPFIGTTMRISPFITKLVQKYLYRESKRTDKLIVFLFHPNECLDVSGKTEATRRTENLIEYLFADVIRHKLKLKNLGLASLKLLDEILTSAREYGFEFVSVSEYRKLSLDTKKRR
jgi:hypothetical protein